MRMPAEAFREETRRGALRDAVQLYVQGLFDQMAQIAVCNSVHPVEQRAARWLLMTHDRAGTDRLALTQESLARLLGVRRSSVNGAARKLQAAGLIGCTRGRIAVRDRAGLEAASCNCYRAIRDAFARLLG